MPRRSSLSWFSLPPLATDLAITRTSVMVDLSIHSWFAIAANCDATSKLDRSTSDRWLDQTAFASLLDLLPPLLPASAIHAPQEHDRPALFRLDSRPPDRKSTRLNSS